MRVGVLLAGIAAFWVQPANAAILITGQGTGILRDFPEACAIAPYEPECRNPAVKEGRYAFYITLPGDDVAPGTYLDVSRMDDCPALGLSRCVWSGTIGQGFSYEEWSHGAFGSQTSLDTLTVSGTSFRVARYDADFGPALFLLAVTAVPEPSTWAMLLLGFATIGAAWRRSQRKPAARGQVARRRLAGL